MQYNVFLLTKSHCIPSQTPVKTCHQHHQTKPTLACPTKSEIFSTKTNKTEETSIKTDSDVMSNTDISNKSGVRQKKKESKVEDKSSTDNIAAEDLPEKMNHKIDNGCSLFHIHTGLYFLYICLSIVLAVFGTILIIRGNWKNAGYFSLHHHQLNLAQGGRGGPGLTHHGLGVAPSHLLDRVVDEKVEEDSCLSII